MNVYSLRKNQYRQLFDKISTHQLLLFGSSIFLVIVTIGVIYFGRTNYFFAFCIMLSIYGVILGFLMAKTEYQSQLPNTHTFSLLQLLLANNTGLQAIISETNTVLFQNKPTDKGYDYTGKTVLEFIDALNLHELDKVTLMAYLESGEKIPFATTYALKLENDIEKWMSCSIQPTRTDEGQRVLIFQIEDTTDAQQAILSQQQYIKDMENIIELNYNPTSSLHLISKMASHRDAAQPIKTIQSYVRLIENEYKNKLDKKGQDAINHISKSSYQLETMIEDLFSMTGINDRKCKEPIINLNDIIKEVKGTLASSIQTTQAKINIKSLPKIQADRNQLYVLFQNLIENAIKYCGQQSPVITIDSRKENHHWMISVSDQGMGIEESEKVHIFDYLNRGKIKTGIKGLGLGLPICKQIVENHNGEIWVESDGVGKGSSFVFALPIQPIREVKKMTEIETCALAMSA